MKVSTSMFLTPTSANILHHGTPQQSKVPEWRTAVKNVFRLTSQRSDIPPSLVPGLRDRFGHPESVILPRPPVSHHLPSFSSFRNTYLVPSLFAGILNVRITAFLYIFSKV